MYNQKDKQKYKYKVIIHQMITLIMIIILRENGGPVGT